MRDLSDTEVARLQELLDEMPQSSMVADAPTDVSALDGYLCGVLLQPQTLPEREWWPYGASAARHDGLTALVRQRYAVLADAIAQRRWFDPWIFELGEGDTAEGRQPASADDGADSMAAGEGESHAVRDSVLPWVAGFAMAVERFPALMRHEEHALAEPLALLYLHFDADDLEGLEDEPTLAAALAEAEPPGDLGEAAEDLVRAVLLLADVSRPIRPPAPPGRRTAPAHANPGPGPHSRSGRPARGRRG